MFFLAATTTAEPDAGWGRLVALVLTAVAFWAFTVGYKRYKDAQNTTSSNPSPAKIEAAVSTVKPQVTAAVDSDHRGAGATTAVVVRTPATVAQPSPIDEFVRMRLNTMTTTQIVRDAKRALSVSDATAWRAIRKARKESQ